jgi:hypothetical protein
MEISYWSDLTLRRVAARSSRRSSSGLGMGFWTRSSWCGLANYFLTSIEPRTEQRTGDAAPMGCHASNGTSHRVFAKILLRLLVGIIPGNEETGDMRR